MSQQKPPKKKYNKTINTAARLSGSAIQMGVVIYLGVWGGKWLDGHFGTEKVFLSFFFFKQKTAYEIST